MTTEHPVRALGAVVVIGLGVIGGGWALFERLEQYDLNFVEVVDAIEDLQRVVEANDKRQTQLNEAWLLDDKNSHAAQSRLINSVIQTQRDIRVEQQKIVAALERLSKQADTIERIERNQLEALGALRAVQRRNAQKDASQ